MKIQIKLLGCGALASFIPVLAFYPVEAFATDSSWETPTLDQEEVKADDIILTGSWRDELAQATTAEVVITDVQIDSTPDGLTVVLVSDQPLSAGTSRVESNALITEIPRATLNLTDGGTAEAFGPAEGIALVQVSNLPGGGVQVAITGTDAPPEATVSAVANNLVLSVVPGTAVAGVDDSEAIQVVVTATRTEEDVLDVPRSITVIEREEIEQQLSITNNLADILGQLVPGLAPPPFTNETAELELRGRPIVVLIDGVPQTPNSNGNAADLRVIAPELVERIEVLRGPSAIVGDGGTGGIVNIITRNPTEEGVAYTLSTGVGSSLTNFGEDSVNYEVNLGVSASDENVDGLLSVSYDVTNSLYDADGDRIIPNNISDTDRIGVLAKLGFDITDEQRLGLTYNFFRDDLDTDFIPDESVTAIPGLQKGQALDIGSFRFEEEPQQTNHVINLTYRHENVFGAQLDGQFYYRDRELIQRFTDFRLNPISALPFLSTFPEVWQTTLDSREFGGRLQLDIPVGTANILTGVDYTNERTSRPLLISDTDDFDNNRELNIIDDSTTQGGLYTLSSIAAFTQASWDITDQWQISGGFRYENFDVSVDDYTVAFATTLAQPPEREGGENSFDDVAFNAGLLYRLNPEIGLFFNFAQGFSIPNIDLILGAVGSTFDINDDLLLEPQKVNNYELGARYASGQWQASISGFFNTSELGSNFVFDANGFAELVRAPQRNYGIEATVDWRPRDNWRLGGLFSWNEGENDVDEDGDFVALGSVDIKPFKVQFYLENETTPGWTNRLQLLAVGGRNRAFEEGVDFRPIEGYVTVDLLSNLQLGGGTLSLGVSNIFNTQYLPAATQVLTGTAVEARRAAAPGRTISLRYAIEF